MRPNSRCERCQTHVRTAVTADTHQAVILDPHITHDPNAWEVIHFDNTHAYVQPLPPGTTPHRGKGLAYHEHTCPTTLAAP